MRRIEETLQPEIPPNFQGHVVYSPEVAESVIPGVDSPFTTVQILRNELFVLKNFPTAARLLIEIVKSVVGSGLEIRLYFLDHL